MKLKVVGIEAYDYAHVSSLRMEGEGFSVSLELPHKVLEEVGWTPVMGDEVELVLEEAPGDLGGWEIVMSGRLLKASGEMVVCSFGGFLLTLKGPHVKTLGKIYLKLRRLKR